jgi:hypothetical protein
MPRRSRTSPSGTCNCSRRPEQLGRTAAPAELDYRRAIPRLEAVVDPPVPDELGAQRRRELLERVLADQRKADAGKSGSGVDEPQGGLEEDRGDEDDVAHDGSARAGRHLRRRARRGQTCSHRWSHSWSGSPGKETREV